MYSANHCVACGRFVTDWSGARVLDSAQAIHNTCAQKDYSPLWRAWIVDLVFVVLLMAAVRWTWA